MRHGEVRPGGLPHRPILAREVAQGRLHFLDQWRPWQMGGYSSVVQKHGRSHTAAERTDSYTSEHLKEYNNTSGTANLTPLQSQDEMDEFASDSAPCVSAWDGVQVLHVTTR